MSQIALMVGLAFAAGTSFVIQQAVNAQLRSAIGSAAWAGFVSYLGGTLCMLLLAFATGQSIPGPRAIAESDWLDWTGGVWGAIYIAISIALVPRLGAATFVAILVCGQMLTSLVADKYGWLGLVQRDLDLSRVLGASLLVAGVVLIRR